MGLYENGLLTPDLVDSNRNHYCYHQILGYHVLNKHMYSVYTCVYMIYTP